MIQRGDAPPAGEGLVPRVFRLETAAVELLHLWGLPGSPSPGDGAA
ncbi:hypothetical protein L6R50_23515 [Myxococcota bacterium]|nr:hypothetical protein [Myxococcota bacterium]